MCEGSSFLDGMSMMLSPLPDCDIDDFLEADWSHSAFAQASSNLMNAGMQDILNAPEFSTPPLSNASIAHDNTSTEIPMEFDLSDFLKFPADSTNPIDDLSLPALDSVLLPNVVTANGEHSNSSQGSSPMQYNSPFMDEVDELVNTYLINNDSEFADNNKQSSFEVVKNERNTPSPTGSCSSSDGSSTSGVQSDASWQPTPNQTFCEQMDFESSIATNTITVGKPQAAAKQPASDSTNQVVASVQPIANAVPIISVVGGTFIPVQAVPIGNIAAPINVESVKAGPKLAPKFVSPAKKTVIQNSTTTTTSANSPKPKTIVLSHEALRKLSNSNNSNSKIIIKDAHGKVISNHHRFVSNRQFNAKVTSSSSSINNKKNTPIAPTEIVDEKLIKKQQRMIKNRESASLSRKKKKEYIESLESRLNNLEKENIGLKTENTSLRKQLAAIARACKCRNSNISQFVLDSLNGSDDKPAVKSSKQRVNPANVKRSVALLLAMAVMVTFQVGDFPSYLKKDRSIEFGDSLEAIVEETSDAIGSGIQNNYLIPLKAAPQHNEKHNRSRRSIDGSVPPLHILSRGHGVNGGLRRRCAGNKYCDGCLYGNQTENMRVADNLYKWIDNQNWNNSIHLKDFDNTLDNAHGFKLAPDYLHLKNALHLGKRKSYFGNDFDASDNNGKLSGDRKRAKLDLDDVFMDIKSSKLFDGIKRRDDSFYVLSFNRNNLLLSASAYNKSAPPKMSLLLPSSEIGEGGDLKLIQIDCNVVNTTEVELKADMIPDSLLSPADSKRRANNRPVVLKNENETETSVPNIPLKRIKEENISTEDFVVRTVKKETAINKEETFMKQIKFPNAALPKQTGGVRTYYLVGPKTASEAAKSGEKARFVKPDGGLPFRNGSVRENLENQKLFNKITKIVDSGRKANISMLDMD